MSKALKVIGVVAGVVAVVATGGAALGLGLAVGGTVISASTIAAVASVVAAAAMLGSQALAPQAKPPPARGSVTRIIIDPDAPTPYMMGEGYTGGALRHDTGYGATLDGVPNPYRFMAIVYSGGGPVESISPRTDLEPVSSWYNTFLYTDTQLGATPEADALSPQWAGAPGWDANSKLSGLAAIGWSFKFDKEGKRFASGIPLTGAYGKWVKVYDPRKDDTFAGGVGTHRLGDESTYEWSENPALHAGTYAYGRYQNGKRVMGIGLPADGIDWNAVAAWANVCDANSWSIFGRVFEPGDRWANLKDICFAGGGQPVPTGVLSFRYSAPVVALDTITEDDLTDEVCSVVTMQPYRDRINTAIPKYISADHNWEMVDADPVVNSTFLTEDGEEKRDVWPFNLVKNKDQAAQLAAYRMYDTRELSPIILVCKPRLRAYRPGECLHVDLPELGLDHDTIILRRHIDPNTMIVTLELMTETTAKHAYCLGQVATPPPTPAIGQTSQQRDETAAASDKPAGFDAALIAISYPTDSDPADGLVSATDTTITIEAHTRNYTDGAVSVNGGTLTVDDQGAALTASTSTSPYDSYYHVYYDDSNREGGAVTYKATADSTVASNKASTPYRHYVGTIPMDVSGGSGTSTGGSPPPGWDPDAHCVADDTLILLADQSEAPARDLTTDTMLFTLPEDGEEWGYYPVESIEFAIEPVFRCEIAGNVIRATENHRFMVDGEWVTAGEIGTPDGEARVAKIGVTKARTYVSNGVLSHNIKAGGP